MSLHHTLQRMFMTLPVGDNDSTKAEFIGAPEIDLNTLEQVFRHWSLDNPEVSLNAWLQENTLARYRDWTPAPRPGETTLVDIGCYQPSIGYYWRLGWKTVLGVTKEAGELLSPEKHNRARDPEVCVVLGDIEREQLPVAANSVDAVMMTEVFEHLALDPMHALIEVNRVLKPGGRLIFTTPNGASSRQALSILAGEVPWQGLEFSGHSTNRHNRLYSCRELLTILDAAGFSADYYTSRNYGTKKGSVAKRVAVKTFDHALKTVDKLNQLFSKHRRIERDDYLIVLAHKSAQPKERYPSMLYFDASVWPEWYQQNAEQTSQRSSQ